MTEPTEGPGNGPAPKGSAPAPGFGGSASFPSDVGSSASSSPGGSDSPGAADEAATTAFPAAGQHAVTQPGVNPPAVAPPAATQHRAEGVRGGVSTAHSGGAAGRAAPIVSPTDRRGPLESVLVLRRIDPWSAFTTVLGLMFALYLVWMVAIGVTYLLLSGMGVWDRLGGLLSGVAGDESASVIGPSTILLYSGGVGLLNVLLLSILATLAVFIYNLAAGLTGGGVQVTLSDRRV